MKKSTTLKLVGLIGLFIGVQETFFPISRLNKFQEATIEKFSFFTGPPEILLIGLICILIFAFWPGNGKKIDK